MPVDYAAVLAARTRLAGVVRRTPVLTSGHLDRLAGCQVFLKCENLQRVGAFKFRGASNAVLALAPGEAARGVATHSSGNHAQALAKAARARGIPAWVVMPENAPAVKVAAVKGYGAEVVSCAPTLEAREAAAAAIVARTGATLVHPFDDPRVIAGQGTAALELLEDAGGLDAILVPVGGGGLLSGTAVAAAGASPGTRVHGTEPALADDAARGFASGVRQPALPPRTIADGLRTSLSPRTFALIRRLAAGIETVPEDGIVAAQRLLFERVKLVVETSSAVPVAALLQGMPSLAGKRVGVILSGGNVDLDQLPWTSRS